RVPKILNHSKHRRSGCRLKCDNDVFLLSLTKLRPSDSGELAINTRQGRYKLRSDHLPWDPMQFFRDPDELLKLPVTYNIFKRALLLLCRPAKLQCALHLSRVKQAHQCEQGLIHRRTHQTPCKVRARSVTPQHFGFALQRKIIERQLRRIHNLSKRNVCLWRTSTDPHHTP